MNGETKKFVSVKDLVIEYTSGGSVIHAVNGVSFDLAEGSTIGLVGKRGGKNLNSKSDYENFTESAGTYLWG